MSELLEQLQTRQALPLLGAGNYGPFIYGKDTVLIPTVYFSLNS